MVNEINGSDGLEVAFQALKFSRTLSRFVEVLLNGRIEDVAYEGRFSRTRNACDHGEDIEGEVHIDAFEIVFARSFDGDFAIPLSARSGELDAFASEEIVEGVASRTVGRGGRCSVGGVGSVGFIGKVSIVASPNHLSPQTSGFRANVDDVVGSAHDVFVVFHHNDRIAHIAEFLKHVDKAFGVARVQTDGGFVEDVETAHQTTAEGGGEIDALAFSSRQTVGQAVEGEIVEAHFFEEMQAVVDFRQQALCHLLFVVGELELGKPESEFFDRHFHEVGNGFSSHFDVKCFWAESFSSTIRTSGFAAIASEHHAILDFILSHL